VPVGNAVGVAVADGTAVAEGIAVDTATGDAEGTTACAMVAEGCAARVGAGVVVTPGALQPLPRNPMSGIKSARVETARDRTNLGFAIARLL
jgi:hypothetical protein